MKKKNLNIILIIAVGLIWGILIYKYVNNQFASDDTTQVNYGDNSADFKVSSKIKKDTFQLKEYERDPFLGKMSRRRERVVIHNGVGTKPKKSSTAPKTITPWPQIQYIGYVKEEKSKNPLLLLKINGKFLRKKADQEFLEGLKIQSFYKDSIIVRYNKEEKTIKK